MNTLIQSFVEKIIFRHFLQISLSDAERNIYTESVRDKIVPSIKWSVIIGLCTIPSILFFESTTLTNILIPITMVSGTAWFAISVANIKKKFEGFALELITSMYKSFTSSLVILLFIGICSFISPVTGSISAWSATYPTIQIIAGIIGILPLTYIMWHLFVGALKYDMNDGMLAGQHEVAERYFKDALFQRSLNLLYRAVEELRDGKSLSVANYYLGLAFAELFTYINNYVQPLQSIDVLIEKCMLLRTQPDMDQNHADTLCTELVKEFIQFSAIFQNNAQLEKFIQNIHSELEKITTFSEEHSIVDTRMATILEEIGEILKMHNQELLTVGSDQQVR